MNIGNKIRELRKLSSTKKRIFQSSFFIIILFYYLAVAKSESAGSVCFIGIDVSSGSEFRADSDNDVAENGASVGVYLEGNDVLVLDTCSLSVFGSHVDMTLCNDNTVFEVELTAGTYELASGSSRNVAALSDGSGNAERSCICEGNLYLRSLSRRAENTYVRNGLFRAYDGNSLLAGKLAGLAQILFFVRVAPLPKRISTCSSVR